MFKRPHINEHSFDIVFLLYRFRLEIKYGKIGQKEKTSH